MASFSSVRAAVEDRVHRQQHYEAHLKGLSARNRHELFMNQYARFYGGSQEATPAATDRTVTDLDVLQQNHKFIRTDADNADDSWAVRLAKRYYDKLFKEYAIADLSRYKESKVGMRWRTEQELLAGKGQFVCGGKGCNEEACLCSYEVNFGYTEDGERKQALVKLRVCPACAYKLNYKKEKVFRKVQAKLLRHEQQQQQREARETKRLKRRDAPSSPPAEGAAQPVGTSRMCSGGEAGTAAQQTPTAADSSGPQAHALGTDLRGNNGQHSCSNQEAEALAEKLLAEEFEHYFEGMFA